MADKALLQVDNSMIDFGTKAAALSNDVAQIGQNVTDKGVIATLLPPEQETVFTDKVNEVKQTVAQVKDAIDSVRNFMRAFQAIPFIQTPNLDDSLLGKLDDAIRKVEELVGQLIQGIENLRNGIAGAIDQVSSALAELSDAVFQARFPVARAARLRAVSQSSDPAVLAGGHAGFLPCCRRYPLHPVRVDGFRHVEVFQVGQCLAQRRIAHVGACTNRSGRSGRRSTVS